MWEDIRKSMKGEGESRGYPLCDLVDPIDETEEGEEEEYSWGQKGFWWVFSFPIFPFHVFFSLFACFTHPGVGYADYVMM